MTCEEFEAVGLNAERDASRDEVQRAAAREHVSACPRCAALQDSWQAARVELRAFAEDTAAAQAPARVEMRLRQEFRTQHGTLKMRRAAVVAAWALATAAVLAGALSWRNWRKRQQEEATMHLASPSAGHLPANDGSGVKNHEASVQGEGAGGTQRPDAAQPVEHETLLAN